MAQEQSVSANDLQEPLAQPQAQKEDNSVEAIKFIKEKLQSSFDEQNAKQLFEYYTLDKATQRLQPPDVRKLLLDILSASEWPLVVPDESLDAVLHELCLNDEGSISWIEFKSFFVFLQDRPLIKLFEIITKLFTKKQLSLSRLITIKPVQTKPIEEGQENDNDDNKAPTEPPSAEQKQSESPQDKKASIVSEQNYYDRNKWKAAIEKLIPSAKQIFIYFMDGWQVLALAIGGFDDVLTEPAAAEVKLDDMTTSYLATIRAFDVQNDIFPPIARSGGMKSKVARKIADSYIIARQWDEKHLKIVEKTANAAHKVSIKWTEFDEKYKVNERVNATTTSIINSVKAFDEKHQLTRRLSNSAKQFDEKFGISQKVQNVANKIAANEKVQSVANKTKEAIQGAVKTIDDIGQETQQLVQEKRQQSQQENGDDVVNGNGDNEENEDNVNNEDEGGAAAQQSQQQQYDAAPVQVQAQ